MPHFAGQEIVGLAAFSVSHAPVVATKMAIRVESGTILEGRYLRGRVRQRRAGWPRYWRLRVAVARWPQADHGHAELAWTGTVYGRAMQANKSLPALEHPVALHQFMRELHSGAYFIWQRPGNGLERSLGVVDCACPDGLWMWWKIQQQKAVPARGA